MKKEKIDRPIGLSLDTFSEERFKEMPCNSASEHPTVEQMFIRQAIKYLTPKQRAIWEYHNYDRLTQDEIAEKLGITQQAVGQSIKACERRIAKYCKDNQGAYKALKQEYSQND